MNTFGRILRVTTWGESHGDMIGCILDGVPSCIPLCEADIQPFLNQRRPGGAFVSQRKEKDEVRILSGVFEGKTTGTPISLCIMNEDHRSKDYDDIAHVFRPGHADYTYFKKYQHVDYRGGGRSSARETAMRVAAGGVARAILKHFFNDDLWIGGHVVQLGQYEVERSRCVWSERDQNVFFCCDSESVPLWEEYLSSVRKRGTSVGAMVEIVAKGVPCGLGAPVYGKIDADLASAMMSINAVKSVEIGDGVRSALCEGHEYQDAMHCTSKGEVEFSSNHAGGILGGISNGNDIVVRFAVKPTSSILVPQETVTKEGQQTTVQTKGRHDPCVGLRAVPVGEAMMALTLADHVLLHLSTGKCVPSQVL